MFFNRIKFFANVLANRRDPKTIALVMMMSTTGTVSDQKIDTNLNWQKFNPTVDMKMSSSSNNLTRKDSVMGWDFNKFPILNNESFSRQLNLTMTRSVSTSSSVVGRSGIRGSHDGYRIHEITKNIQLFTNDSNNVTKDPKTLRILTEPNNQQQRDKPLVVILSWLLAKQKHIGKYAQLYLGQGFDVISVAVTPWQLLWPAKGSQIIAADVVKFLENNLDYNTLLLHGFSVGGYVWGECMVHMARDMDRYAVILNRIVGQVWDSATDITEIPIGVPRALFPKNYTLQNALKSYMVYHLKTFHEPATRHYIRSSQIFYNTIVKRPALFFISKTDPVGSIKANTRVRESWEAMGIECNWKCWDKSPHVGHFHKYRDEYLDELHTFLQSVNMIRFPERIRAKL